MRVARVTNLTPTWLVSYAGMILLVSFMVNLANGFAQNSHSLTIPSMREAFHISYTQTGALMTATGGLRMGGALVSGILAPRFGSRFMIAIGTLASGTSMLLLGYSGTLIVALAGMALMGLSSGLALTPMMGLHARWFASHQRGLAAGVAASGGSLAFVVTGLVAPWFIGQSPFFGWRHTWQVFGVMVIVVGVLSLVFLRDRPKARPSTSPTTRPPRSPESWPFAVYKNPLVWLLSFLAFCSGSSVGVFSTFFGAYLTQDHGIDLVVVGRLLIMIGVLSVVSSILWGKVSDQIGRGRAFVLSFLVLAAGFALFWLSPAPAALILASALLGLTLRAAYTLCAAASGDHVDANFAAAAFGLMAFGAGVGTTVSPVVSGAITDAVGMRWAFALALGVSLMGAAGAMVLPSSSRSPSAVKLG